LEYFVASCFDYNIIMARFSETQSILSSSRGTSGAEVSDLNPEHQYDVDLRRLGIDDKDTALMADTANEAQQSRVSRYLKAARLANKYMQSSASPSDRLVRGDRIGRAGSTNYANKPTAQSGKPFS